tara:strand:- start:137 stop:478 length:342 start_codon:yes stop_codon:yes gene_type:complete
MKFIFLGNYSNAGLEGFIKNPNQDRKSVISSMMEKAGGTLQHIYLTRGNYDIVVIGEAPDFETVGAIKMMIMATGAFDEAVILEETDFNKIAQKASDNQVHINLQIHKYIYKV